MYVCIYTHAHTQTYTKKNSTYVHKCVCMYTFCEGPRHGHVTGATNIPHELWGANVTRAA